MGQFEYQRAWRRLEALEAAKSATEGNEEGEAIDEALGEAAECSENRLYEAEES